MDLGGFLVGCGGLLSSFGRFGWCFHGCLLFGRFCVALWFWFWFFCYIVGFGGFYRANGDGC